MSEVVEFKTIVRADSVARLLRALEGAGVTRFWISHVHSVGAGADPKNLRFSLGEETSYSEKTKIEFLAPAANTEALVEIVRCHSASGHRGDGVVGVTDIARVVNVRTGDTGAVALL